jgi:hypothetical protein
MTGMDASAQSAIHAALAYIRSHVDEIDLELKVRALHLLSVCEILEVITRHADFLWMLVCLRRPGRGCRGGGYWLCLPCF